MSVEIVQGNILDWVAGIQVIAHVMSRQNVAGAGLAKQINNEYPSAFDPYHEAFANGAKPPLGAIIAAEAAGGKRFIHMLAQDQIGTDRRQLDYEALWVCLEGTRDILVEAHSKGRDWVLGLPMWLGAGLAGGAPRIVEAMVREAFEDCVVRCVVVRYVKPAKPS